MSAELLDFQSEFRSLPSANDQNLGELNWNFGISRPHSPREPISPDILFAMIADAQIRELISRLIVALESTDDAPTRDSLPQSVAHSRCNASRESDQSSAQLSEHYTIRFTPWSWSQRRGHA